MAPSPSQGSEIESLLKIINSKQDVLTDKAIQAKKNYSPIKVTTSSTQNVPEEGDLEKEHFNKNIQALNQLLRATRFNDLIYFLSHPNRVLTLNFLIGLVRGIGFAIGFLLIISCFFYIIMSIESPESWHHLWHSLTRF